LRQSHLRGHLPQPPVHGSKPFALFALREHSGRGGSLTGHPRTERLKGGASTASNGQNALIWACARTVFAPRPEGGSSCEEQLQVFAGSYALWFRLTHSRSSRSA